ncbi:hypothetical protein TRIP_D50040 [uncultured Paludibacter sp.]|uniref:DUF4595 domain-containing protein n=1 Tax=uncultured Paludibacter sp. TaxID=497635 RepID=A0A653ALM9_9BACT|nr:hypothetical protein TRIP_D50040 [uncultured Paludibacter sp.]
MKKVFLFLFFSSFILSCETLTFPDAIYGKIGNSQKHLVKISQDEQLWTELKYDIRNRIYQIIRYYENESDTAFLEYNTNNQVTERKYGKIYVDKYIYQNGKLIQSLSFNLQNPEWNVKLVYRYKNNRIDYANKYMNNNLVSKIQFGYNNNGNVISRKEYGIESTSDIPMKEYNYTYDNKINPFHDLIYCPIDIIQTNNAVTMYHYAIFMSSLPTVYGMNYEYDKDGFPISATRYDTKHPYITLNTYKFIYNQ